MAKKILILLVIAASVFVTYRQTHKDYYDYLIMSGATPLAVARRVPSFVTLEIDGLVKKKYRFTGDALNALAFTRIRTREITPAGQYTGAYIYVGIPVFNILEGIAPCKPENASFSSPLDLLVTFVSASGEKVHFSYNELLMTADSEPITLAFSRRPVIPTTEAVQQSYTANLFPEELTGLRLICPREPDTARYLDNVVQIVYGVIALAETDLPPRRKNFTCRGETITCIDGPDQAPGIFNGVARKTRDHWVRVGHGHGFDDIATAEGYDLRAFLTTNYNGAGPEDFYLFVACDGYRSLFSGREIFSTDDGAAMLIADRLSGGAASQGYMLAPTKDYFSDRAMWGLSHIVRFHRAQIEN